MRLTVNGEPHVLQDTEPWESLLFVLRERLGLYATKNACEQGECGSCSVLVGKQVVCACLTPVAQVQGQEVTTLEGLAADPVARQVGESMVARGGVQCGFCTPGFVLTATALLTRNPAATAEELREGLAGNLCRCTGYGQILQALGEVRDLLGAARRGEAPPGGRPAAGGDDARAGDQGAGR
ncbi:(2Fe-2S)-binding protein [Streptomyces sp. NPDC059460]|uniref:(2Fe-2S)-binding protein n=1 Tax=Streptomyces sp. NPDC059460 TaxID=3346840 RepID=UPI0036806B48